MDYPHETGRTATDLIMSGLMRRFTRVNVILSHAGDTLPYLATRPAALLYDYGLSDKNIEEFLEDASRYYYDTALSINKHTMNLLLGFAHKNRILFGSDFPYAPTRTVERHTKMLGRHDLDEEIKRKIARENDIALIPRLQNLK